MRVKQRLRDVRTEQGISQEALAELLGVSRQTVSKWETGAARPSAGNLAALSEIFGLPVDAFVKDDWTAPEAAEPIVQVVEAPAPPPAPRRRHSLWPALLALLVGLGIAVGVFYLQNRHEAPVSNYEAKSEVIDPAIIGGRIELLPLIDPDDAG